MKRLFFSALIVFIFLSSSVYAIDTRLLDLRNRILNESDELRVLLPNSKDAVILVSMFDSCLIAASQIDAYFHMLGIFESIKEKDLTDVAFDFILSWLNEIKNTNNLNIKNLSASTQTNVPTTQVHVEKLKGYFIEFNNRIKTEIDTVSMLKKTFKIKQ